jgi:hypothetical protein
MTPWTRDHTRQWIQQLESRVQDIEHYLYSTIEWCEQNGVYSQSQVFVCCVLTVAWVCQNRGESITKKELFEILGEDHWWQVSDQYFEINPAYSGYDLYDLLELALDSF